MSSPDSSGDELNRYDLIIEYLRGLDESGDDVPDDFYVSLSFPPATHHPLAPNPANASDPLQAAAPQPQEIIPNESATSESTGSLIDVDSGSVRTVPSDFLEQDVQTETQAERIRHEEELKETAKAAKEKLARNKEKAKAKARRADGAIVDKIAALSDEQATGLVYTNVALVAALGGFLGYKGLNLHQRGLFSWKYAGVGAAVVGAVGLFESGFYRYVSTSFLACCNIPQFSWLKRESVLMLSTCYIATSPRPAAARRPSGPSLLRKSHPRLCRVHRRPHLAPLNVWNTWSVQGDRYKEYTAPGFLRPRRGAGG